MGSTIVAMGNRAADTDKTDDDSDDDIDIQQLDQVQDDQLNEPAEAESSINRAPMQVDATSSPIDIAYPRHLGLFNPSREKCEEFIDKLFTPMHHGM